MVLRIIYCILIIIYTLFLPLTAFAKTYAWVIDEWDSKAYKLDVSASKIIQTITLKEFDAHELIADKNSNQLFITCDYGRWLGQGVRVFNLKDLTLKKDLGITSDDPSGVNFPKLIVPPVGNKFYVIWWDSSKAVDYKGGEIYSVYDKTTLNKIGDLTSFPKDLIQTLDLEQESMFSLDGSKLYSINMGANEIKVYDSITLALLETISIANIWGTPLYSKIVESDTKFLGSGDKLLFSENIKSAKSDPNNIKSFAYNISTKSISNKVTIKEGSDEVLSPDGSKIVTNEIAYIRDEFGNITKINHLNKIRIYDVATGQMIKYFDLSDRYTGMGINAISPDSSKLYLGGGTLQTDIYSLIVIDLKDTLSIVAELPISGWMTFFEE